MNKLSSMLIIFTLLNVIELHAQVISKCCSEMQSKSSKVLKIKKNNLNSQIATSCITCSEIQVQKLDYFLSESKLANVGKSLQSDKESNEKKKVKNLVKNLLERCQEQQHVTLTKIIDLVDRVRSILPKEEINGLYDALNATEKNLFLDINKVLEKTNINKNINGEACNKEEKERLKKQPKTYLENDIVNLYNSYHLTRAACDYFYVITPDEEKIIQKLEIILGQHVSD